MTPIDAFIIVCFEVFCGIGVAIIIFALIERFK